VYFGLEILADKGEDIKVGQRQGAKGVFSARHEAHPATQHC